MFPQILQSQVLVEGPAMIGSFEQESGSNGLEIGREPVTPELGKQDPNRGRFGLPTPDTTPESRRIASGHHQQGFARPVNQRDTAPDTPPTSSRAPSTEEITTLRNNSQESIHNETTDQPSERPNLLSAPEPHINQDNKHSVSVIKLVFNSLISVLNLAKQRKSRADDARVQRMITVIKDVPKTKRTRVVNLTNKLTAKQYGQLLKAIKDSKDDEFRFYCEEKLRYDYTRHRKEFEIRMPTTMHEELGDFIMDQVSVWRQNLRSSSDPEVVKAANSIKSSGSADINFPFAKGEGDKRSPDKSFRHKNCECKPRCVHPTLVVEIAWTQEQKYLQNKAEAYIRRSQGQIRTVISVLMRKMYQAELKNESRLFKAYMKEETDDNASYSSDEKNETGEASILVWRAVTRRNGTIDAVCVQDEKFRDEAGRPIPGVSLRLPLRDFICKGNMDSLSGDLAEELEISSEALCESIDDTLKDYRRERDEVKKEEAEGKKEMQAQEAAQKSSGKKKETRTRALAGRVSDDKGILGRISEQGRLVSTRFKRQGVGR
ncbi:hypothetical protein F5B22DRAFT_44276 [Xylaria bambusicola]|uniref:uncharacterized protein n=1 Tax=Xylaria bambusicola TaxID=326684 RepID=UPI00200890F4|nr:uncharacterized protein F5B22DRAFT_44276 [Xylaria bambusicola]KAI0502832.1 hypothetical protein F5B22DRAFT_44276 [Xylaria bambusicola]